MRAFYTFLSAVLVFALVLGGCKKEDDTTGPNAPAHASGAYTGTLAGATVSGSMTLNIGNAKANPSYEVQAVITVTGWFRLAGDTTDTQLMGTYNTDNDSLYVMGGGFYFRGTYTNGLLQGEFITSTGATGGFVAQTGSDTAVLVFFGTWSSTTDTSKHGTFNMCSKGNSIAGFLVVSATGKVPFVGSINNNTIKIQPAVAQLITVATGSFNTEHTRASGTYDLTTFHPAAGAGIWSADLQQ